MQGGDEPLVTNLSALFPKKNRPYWKHGVDMARRGWGMSLGVAAFFWWGGAIMYLPLLKPAGALEIVVFRILGTLVFVGVLIVACKQLGHLRAILLPSRDLLLLSAASLLIATNWTVYFWSVNANRVLEAALGAYISPLITVVIAVVVLHERLGGAIWVALAIAAVAMVILAIDSGGPPWIALTIAATFSMYGLLKSQVRVGALVGLFVETLMLAVPSLLLSVGLGIAGRLTFWSHGTQHWTLLLGVSIITGVPLLLFAAASTRVPLATLGLLQYITPSLMVLIGLAVYGEHFPILRLLGFGLVWIALSVFVVAGVANHRAIRRFGGKVSAPLGPS